MKESTISQLWVGRIVIQESILTSNNDYSANCQTDIAAFDFSGIRSALKEFKSSCCWQVNNVAIILGPTGKREVFATHTSMGKKNFLCFQMFLHFKRFDHNKDKKYKGLMKRMSSAEFATFEKHQVAQHFTSISSTYNKNNYLLAGKRGKYPDLFRRHRYILEMISDVQGRALEVGCGSGEMLCVLMEKNLQVVGVDLSLGMIQASRSLIAQRLPAHRADLMLGDIEQLCFPDASFDIVIAAGVIEYLISDKKVLHELHRILRPGGVVIFSVRNKVNLSRPLTTLRDLLKAAPIVGPILMWMSQRLHNLLALPANTGLPGRRHIPWQLKRCLRATGFIPKDCVFYHFTVFPRFLERRFPNFCIHFEEKFETFSRTPLGYFANQYIIKAQKTDV